MDFIAQVSIYFDNFQDFFGGGLLTPNLLGFFVRPNKKGSETIPLSVNGLGTVGCGVSP